MDNLNEMEEHLALLSNRENKLKKEREEATRLLKMPFYKRMQQPSQLERLERLEEMQKETFFNLVKKRDELKHLNKQKEDLFCEYWLDWLKGKVLSINDFFYKDCSNISIRAFFDLRNKNFKKLLRKKFIDL